MSEFDITPTSHILMDDSTLNNAKVKVFGVGGAGGNTVNRMVGMNIEGVEYYAVNTDAMALDLSKADHKIAIGQKTTKTLGAGAKPEIGRKAAEENVEDLKEAMKGADMIFITAGMGGGTGTGAAPVVGAVARELGILTVAVVTKPFRHEGPVRSRNAEKGIKALRENVDTMIVVDNKKLMKVVEETDKKMTLDGAFKLTDEILGNAVRSICGIMFNHGLIHVDFADVKTVMSNGGSALMGTGIAEGEGRGIKAVDTALSSPLLEDVNVEGATGVLVNVSHGENFSMLEYDEAMEHIYEAVGEMGDPNIIIGDILIPELGDQVCITVIATGCGGTSASSDVKPMFASASDVPAATQSMDVVNSIGAPSNYQQAPQPVAATPRPTATNFVALAQTVPMGAVPQAEVQAPAMDFASAQFNAQAPAFEEKLMPQGIATATLPETEEMPGIADMDQLSNGDYGTPAYTRQTMTEMPAREVEEPRNTNYAEGSLKTSGVDYDVPAFLRNGGFKLDSF
ncbi:MAG: cell division protein FtsZ [Fibrobacter sp.]|nr:cell division protein FtsZ [Fibrobacter sp.]